MIQNLFGLRSIGSFEKYLDLPTMVGRNKTATFNYIKSRIWGRISSWKSKFLSQVRKEILLKAVIQAIPNNFMVLFQLPKTHCAQIA